MRTHAVPTDVLDLLASGGGDTLGVLRAGQRSKRLLMVHEVVRMARCRVPSLVAEAGTDDAFVLLADAQRRSPSAVDDLLLHPQVGAWASHCLGGLLGGDGVNPEDLGHLGAIAAAAALRAGLGFRARTRLRCGSVMLPTFGLARAWPGVPDSWCELRSRPGANGFDIVAPGAVATVSSARGESWLPLRRLCSSAGGVDVGVDLDDLDPYRSGGILTATDRLADAEVAEWQTMFDEGWAVLTDYDPARANAISAGIVSVVPLRATADDSQLSATLHQALGAVAMTAPNQPLTMALALVHEFQHTKLSALLDLVPLVERPAPERYYSPWRRDPRPLSGLLQGAYAFLALTRFWGIHRERTGDPVAHFEFALGREQVRDAIATLRAAGRLLPQGTRFVDGMRRRLDQLASAPVPDHARRFADLARRDHELSWRLRNLQPDPDLVAAWADAWLAGRSCPHWDQPPRPTLRDGGGPIPSDQRADLLRHRLADPERWQEEDVGASPGDLLLVAGEPARATAAYATRIQRTPDELASWSGLALTLPIAHPEQVYALHHAVRTRGGTAPSPAGLAAWLS